MSNHDYKSRKLTPNSARTLIRDIALRGGTIQFSPHAISDRMPEREITTQDVMNVLKSESMRVVRVDWEKNGWRYNCATNRFVVVVSFFYKGNGLVVVTVMRADRR